MPGEYMLTAGDKSVEYSA